MPQSRQLVAIMFTDIVGYTAMMQEDETLALTCRNKLKKKLEEEITTHNGRILAFRGDGAMCSFSSTIEGVRAAMALQLTMQTDPEVPLRIGMHTGDVIFEENEIHGDGVNIASRIESFAVPGSIFISGKTHDDIKNQKDIQTISLGLYALKNVKEQVEIFAISNPGLKIPDSNTLEGKGQKVREKESTEKSIAVLPFINMSNDPEQDYFCDGISEEIINALAQLNNLRVIARTSTFSFKDKNMDVREIGKTLDVTTLLEGSVRKSGNRLRITTKLLKVSDGSHILSDRYDRVLEDVFSIQENIAENVATSLKGFLTSKEKEAIRRPGTVIEAYEYFLKGRQLFHQLALNEAKLMFEKAIESDPGYALAYAGLADAHSWLFEWEGADNGDLDAAERNSRKALFLAPDLAESHSSRGFVLSLGKKYDEAEQEFKQAIQLNSNCYDAYYYYGRSCFARGQIQESAHLFRKASEVRREDFQSMILLAQSLRILGSDQAEETAMEGIGRAKKHLKLNPADRRALSLTAGTLFEIGEREEALQWTNKAIDLYPGDTGVLVNAACVFAKNGNKEKALDLLELVFGKGFGKKDWIEHDPDYDSLRNEPRFQVLLAKMR